MDNDWFEKLELRQKHKKEKRFLWTVFIVLFVLFLAQCTFFGCSFWIETQQREREKEKEKLVSSSTFLTAFADGNLRLTCSDDSYASAVAQVRPAVVTIVSVMEASEEQKGPAGGISFDLASTDQKTAIGSGVIVDERGYILTNYHVIGGAKEISVMTFGSKQNSYMARVCLAAPEKDLAVLKIDSDRRLPHATLGDSELVEAVDIVLAIGSPFGLEHTVTKGIISDNKRNLIIEGKEYKDLIQTDAAINRGNSGGPLVSAKGEVIAINTAIYAPTGEFTGLGFAIPINQAKPLLSKVYR